MRTVNIHEAKTHLSRLVDAAAAGESFVIAKAGRPMVRVVALEHPESGAERRLGFMPELQVPEDFDTLHADELRAAFEGGG